MKYIVFFIVVLSISFPALTEVRHYDAIVAAHQTHFQQKYPGQDPQYFELGSPKPSGDGPSFLVVDGETLKYNINTIDVFFEQNPETTLLLDVREGDGFVSNWTLNMGEGTLKESITKLSLSNINNDLVSIGHRFLYGSSWLTSLEFSSLSRLTSIYGRFLYGCSGLTSLDLSPLTKLSAIGDGFLFGCSGLTSLDLSPLSKLKHIGDGFLSGCSGLTSLDLSPLSTLITIGGWFLSGCRGLTSLDLSPLSRLAYIGDNFLSECSGLTSLDLSPLSQVTSIGEGFLSGCSGLTSLDLSPLSQVTSIGDWFLTRCSGLTSLDLSPLSQVTSIGEGFLYRADNLVKILNPESTQRNVLEEAEKAVNQILMQRDLEQKTKNSMLEKVWGWLKW